MTEITVCIPSLLRESLGRTIDSLIRQKIPMHITIQHGNNPSKQRNQLAQNVSTKYILYIDDDCQMGRGSLLSMYTMLESESLDIIYPIIKGTMVTSPLHVGAGGCLLCRAFVPLVVPWDENLVLGEDLDFIWRSMELKLGWSCCEKANVYHLNPERSYNTWGKGNTLDPLRSKHKLRYDWLTKHNSTILGVK